MSTRSDTLFPYMTLFRSVHKVRSAPWPAFSPSASHAVYACHKTKHIQDLPGLEAGFGDLAHEEIAEHGDALGTAQLLGVDEVGVVAEARSEEHTSDLQSLMSISYAVLCLKNK